MAARRLKTSAPPGVARTRTAPDEASLAIVQQYRVCSALLAGVAVRS